MTPSPRAIQILSQIQNSTKLGDIRKIAQEIKKDHTLAMELWSTCKFFPRQLAVLIMDKKLLTQDVLDDFAEDLEVHAADERNQITDWLMANQLTKDKKTVALMESWEESVWPVQRRIFWYYQGRLRWTGKMPVNDNTAELLASIEAKIGTEHPDVQWAMNFTAAQIGIFDPENRQRCVALGEKHGLYKGQSVPKGCTSPYLPEWIKTEVAKLKR